MIQRALHLPLFAVCISGGLRTLEYTGGRYGMLLDAHPGMIDVFFYFAHDLKVSFDKFNTSKQQLTWINFSVKKQIEPGVNIRKIIDRPEVGIYSSCCIWWRNHINLCCLYCQPNYLCDCVKVVAVKWAPSDNETWHKISQELRVCAIFSLRTASKIASSRTDRMRWS